MAPYHSAKRCITIGCRFTTIHLPTCLRGWSRWRCESTLTSLPTVSTVAWTRTYCKASTNWCIDEVSTSCHRENEPPWSIWGIVQWSTQRPAAPWEVLPSGVLHDQLLQDQMSTICLAVKPLLLFTIDGNKKVFWELPSVLDYNFNSQSTTGQTELVM